MRQIPHSYRRATSQLRLMPNFIIIGGQRCGTTSLYNYIIKHPGVAPASRKEVHFFDINFGKGLSWYRAHFPSAFYEKRTGRNLIAGEASPYYLFHPCVPQRVFKALPHIKLIALLRNPVERAYSQYYHSRRNGYETLSFEDAIDIESERLASERDKILQDENYISFSHMQHSYLSKGIYVEQIRNWLNHFPEDQLLIIRSEDFYNEPATIFKLVTDFLDLPSCRNLKIAKKFQAFKYPDMETNTRKKLIEFFEPHNQKLYEYLERDFNW